MAESAIEVLRYDGSTPLDSIRQERFVNGLLEGMTQRQAYREAGYRVSDKQLDSAASQLSRNVKVKARLAYRKAELAQETAITIERQLKKHDEVYASAMREKDHSSANAALKEQSKLAGLYIQDNMQKHNLASLLAEATKAMRVKQVESKELPC